MEVVAEVLIVLGAALTCIAGIGVLRLPGLYGRMHAATKATTIGIGLIGLGVALTVDGGAAKALVSVVLIFVTAPSAAHVVGRAAYGAEGIELALDGPDDLQDLVEGDPPGVDPAEGGSSAGGRGDSGPSDGGDGTAED